MAEVINPRGLPREDAPHSRACGIAQHAHGVACSDNCPTCGGRTAHPALSAAPEAPPATWYEGPHEAAGSLRRWADRLRGQVGGQLSTIDQARLMRDLRGAASVLDGASR